MKKIKQFFSRLRKLWELSANYDDNRLRDKNYFDSKIKQVNNRIGEHTIVHADIHWQHNPHQIIVVGRYLDHDYVRVFNLEANHWGALVEELREVEKNAKVGRIDVPHSMPFSVVYERNRSHTTNQSTRIATLRFYNGYVPAKKRVIEATIASPQSRDFKRYISKGANKCRISSYVIPMVIQQSIRWTKTHCWNAYNQKKAKTIFVIMAVLAFSIKSKEMTSITGETIF